VNRRDFLRLAAGGPFTYYFPSVLKDVSTERRVAVIADTQCGWTGIAQLFPLIAARPVEVVLIAGDVVTIGSQGDDIEARWLETRQWLDGLGKPWRAVPGNHDLVYNGVPVIQHQCGPMNPAALDAWGRHVGPLQFVYELDDTRIIGVNSLDWSEANRAWILSQLQISRRKVIIQHHPLVWPEANWLACNATGMITMYQQAGVSLVIAGHRHQLAAEWIGPMLHIIAPPISYVVNPELVYPLAAGLFPLSYPTLGWLELVESAGELRVEFFRGDGAMVTMLE